MKKLKTKKLDVKIEAIRNLTETQLDTVAGGYVVTIPSQGVAAVNGAMIKKC